MAKNWTMAEAVKVIKEGTDLEAIAEIGKRFPNLAVKVAKITAKAGDDFVDLMGFLGEKVTANKVNAAIKAGVSEATEADEDVEEAADDEATKDYADMTGKELVKLCREHKILKDVIAEQGGKTKGDILAYLEAHPLDGDDENEVMPEPEDEGDEYDDMTAPELFKLCKERGIKARPKKKADYYADLLRKADAEAAEEADDADDDWGEEEEAEEEKPAKKAKAKKPAKKAEPKTTKKAKKPVKQEEPEDDEDDDADEEPEEKPAKKAAKKTSKKAAVEEEDDDDWDI